MGVDAGRSVTKSNWNGAKFSPGNQKEDDVQPHKTEREYSVYKHQGMQKRGKLLKKGTPIAHADPIEANEGPTRQSCYSHRGACGGSENRKRGL